MTRRTENAPGRGEKQQMSFVIMSLLSPYDRDWGGLEGGSTRECFIKRARINQGAFVSIA